MPFDFLVYLTFSDNGVTLMGHLSFPHSSIALNLTYLHSCHFFVITVPSMKLIEELYVLGSRGGVAACTLLVGNPFPIGKGNLFTTGQAKATNPIKSILFKV